LSPILFNLFSEYRTKEVRKVPEEYKMGGQVIRAVKYSDKLLLLAREETFGRND
jgi:hypothetical protein